ncbi:leukemia inhibitory factor receptor-like isoform X2 [Mercenaria mercenaria]|uniref:leukemia inhibitory factor receptor-like isoform X2 n=1 Tax=Mercenaria mercenaria TaxID=6596 RepID=UPI00234F965B|nr:leukemia inhibitory factor receptor-like isoform X2 [Mercenaria mercenaria]
MTFKTSETTEQFPHSRTFCNLHPYTEYTFSVSIQPIGLYSGFFSDETKSVSRTFSDIPSASPELIEGGYSSNQRGCDKGCQRVVCIFWKSIKEEHKNGQMRSVQGLFTAINAKIPPLQDDWATDSTYSCSYLLCNTNYNYTIKARNVNGTSDNGSTITIPSFNPGNMPPQFVVESTNTSEVYISLDQREDRHTKQYIVAWCRNKNRDCQPGDEFSWKHFPSNTTEAVLHIKSSQDFLYGVSVLTEDGSSGVSWQDCVYQKNIPPKREPQNVVVSAGSDDNTLVVKWDKLACESNEPYIAMYNVQFNKLDDINRKSINVAESDEARVVLRDMEEDQTYLVTVRGITKDGRYGPESQPQKGVPVKKSLKPTVIVGISVAALVCAIFAGVGLFCIVRVCKMKPKKAIEEAGNITIPEMPDLVFNNDNSISALFSLIGCILSKRASQRKRNKRYEPTLKVLLKLQ